jgi:hypothetical protein
MGDLDTFFYNWYIYQNIKFSLNTRWLSTFSLENR